LLVYQLIDGKELNETLFNFLSNQVAIYLYMLGPPTKYLIDGICIVERLSYYKSEGYWWWTLRSWITWWSHWIAYLLDIVWFFMDYQQIGDLPMYMM